MVKFFDAKGYEVEVGSGVYEARTRRYFGSYKIDLYYKGDCLTPNSDDGLNRDGSISGLTRTHGIHGGAIIGVVRESENHARSLIWQTMKSQ